mmetsp:Transcript_13027/g.16452  ORF Transcript_13027/g.16452 Transcript_13027/m.16452 type:complete len:138 (+) Transcript_13027:70-483(+)
MKLSLAVLVLSGVLLDSVSVCGLEANVVPCEAADVVPCIDSGCCTPIRMVVGTKLNYKCSIKSGCLFGISTPTADPSISPSELPSLELTADPSASPLESPSLEPTADPSTSPSELPSLEPTADPSTSPSVLPMLGPD